MTSKELRKLSRQDLLEMLIKQEQQNEILQTRIAQLEDLINSRTIEINNVGSMAEASLLLSGVFDAADKAVEQYKENIQRYSELQEIKYNEIVAKAEETANTILNQAEVEKQKKMEEADLYWNNLCKKSEATNTLDQECSDQEPAPDQVKEDEQT